MANKPFPFSVCEQCCGSGDVSPEQIQEAIENYLKENPLESIPVIEEEEIDSIIDGGVYKIVHHQKGIGGAIINTDYELLLVSFDNAGLDALFGTQIRINTEGILYRNRIAVDEKGAVTSWENEWKKYGSDVDLSNYYTKEETEEYIKKTAGMKEVILYEDVVNTQEWTNQPTYEGELDSAFNTDDFYYVTLKDASGNALPDRKFMLKDSYADGAAVYSTVFSFSVPAGGALVENFPIEFTEIGETVKMRDAGVALITATIPAWSLQEDIGTLRTTVQGEFVPKTSNGYCYCMYKTDKNVASYHSANGTTVHQTDNSNQIVAHAAIAETGNKDNMIFDDCTIRRDGNGNFSQVRNFVVRYTNKNVKLYNVVGYGTAGTDEVKSVVAMSYLANNSIGLLRNGTHIRITEVK